MSIERSGPHSIEPPETSYRLTGDETLARLGSGAGGLSCDEVEARLRRWGPNELPGPSKESLLRKFARGFTQLLAILLWVGAGLALAIGLPQLAIAIVSVILINGIFSFWQEFRAERAAEELARLLPANTMVIRAGEQQQVPSSAVVVGDVLLLSEGDHIPADARVLEAHSLATNDAALTGESLPVTRHGKVIAEEPVRPTDVANCLFAGTSVAAGRATAVVTATGSNTAFGAIAKLTHRTRERPSPLQREMDIAVRAITLMVVVVGAGFALLAIPLVGLTLGTALTFALGLIVAFVPEGLLPTLTLSLAMAVQRMARRRALVKHLSAVEALGAATVICTDKTGVLTENRMSVVSLFVDGAEIQVTGVGYAPEGEFSKAGRRLEPAELKDLEPLLSVAALCNYARLKSPEGPNDLWEIQGDPTEGALQVLAAKGGLRVQELLSERHLEGEWPFDAVRQRMTVAYTFPDGLAALTKGSTAAVLERCDRICDLGETRPLTASDREVLIDAENRFTTAGLRVLALARRPFDTADLQADSDAVEHGLVLLGLAAMHDPPRVGVREAVRRCRAAGVRIVIISGDHGSTATAIGRLVGIVTGPTPRVVDGAELVKLDDDALRVVVGREEELVFARTSPEGKLRVVQALQALGHVVAVTGDGVNDAPALRSADVGVAMGLSGTDVARAAADIVLADDNFASIVAAIEEGRAVFDNIRKFTTYIFTSNAAEAIPFILFLLSAGQIPLALPIMLILAVDLGTDMFPALALGAEAAEPDVMQRPPRKRGTHLISGGLLLRSLAWLGLLEGITAMASFFWVYGLNGDTSRLPEARGAAYAGVVLAQIANVLVCRRDRRFSLARPWNWLLTVGIGIELLILLVILYVPAVQRAFGTAALSARGWLVPLIAAPLFFLLEECRKGWSARGGPRSAPPPP